MNPREVSKGVSLTLCLYVLVAFGLFTPARAQNGLSDMVEAEVDRDREYAELAREVAGFERQFGILKRIVKLTSPTVAHIEAIKPRSLTGFPARNIEEAGSGVVVEISGKKYVLTNRHVIKNAEESRIRIKLADGREIYPANVWADPGTDVAVMAVNEPNLIAARLGDSNKVEIGDFVVAVGSPFGLSHSVTYGIISAKGRRDLELGDEGVRFQNFLQTDAAINPGNSGGPLINLRGELIGINTAIASSSGGNEGIGFSIPINMVMGITNQLITKGTVARAFLGVNLDSKFNAATASRLGLPRLTGARISGVTANSPAEAANLQVDDVVLKFGDARIDDDNHLVNLVGLTDIGQEVPLLILRDKKTVQVKVRVGDRSKFEAAQ